MRGLQNSFRIPVLQWSRRATRLFNDRLTAFATRTIMAACAIGGSRARWDKLELKFTFMFGFGLNLRTSSVLFPAALSTNYNDR